MSTCLQVKDRKYFAVLGYMIGYSDLAFFNRTRGGGGVGGIAERSLLLELLCARRLLLVVYAGNFADHEDTQMITFKSLRGIVSRRSLLRRGSRWVSPSKYQ